MKKIFKKKLATSLIIATSFLISASAFAASLTPLNKGDKWGFIDSTGKQVIATTYDGVANFEGGFAPVLLGGLWGFVNEMGQEVVTPKYTGVSYFKDGFSPSTKANKWGVVNTKGVEVVPFVYDEIYYFDKTGKAYAKKEGKWGKVDKTGATKVPHIYDTLDVNANAVVNRAKVMVDGIEIAFDAYNINDNTYFKLRDLAQVMNGSKKQFEVVWNNQNQTMNLIPNKAYTSIGTELEKNVGNIKTLRFSEAIVNKDGQNVTLKSYNISENNYFMLRDVAKLFDVGVTWNNNTKTIGLNTNAGYTE